MTVTTDRKALAEALARVAPLAGRFSVGGADRIRLEADGKTLTVETTNLESGARLTLPAKGKLAPTLAVPMIARQVAALTADQVALSVAKGRLEIEAGATYRSGVTDPLEWPQTPDPSEGEWEPPEHFWRYLLAAASMASTEPKNNPAMMGVLIAERLESSDSYRATTVTVGCPERLLVPASIVSTLKELRPDRITWSERHVGFRGEWGMVWTAKVEGTFPDFSKIEPKPEAFTASIVVDSELLGEIAARSTLAAGSHVPVRFELGTGSVRLFVEGSEGSFSETVEAKVEGSSDVFGFNPAYLRGAIEPADGDVRIDITSPSAPALITSGEHWRAILMPIRGLS